MTRNKLIKWVIFLFSVTLLLLPVSIAKADGFNLGSQESTDYGSGGRKGNWWKPGDYGIRFTVINRKTGKRIARSIDYYKLSDYKSQEIWHTGGNDKLEYIYLNSQKFSVGCTQPYASKNEGYAFMRGNELWNVISVGKSRKTSLKDIKRKYLSSETFLKKVAHDIGGGMTLDTIKSKENQVVLGTKQRAPKVYLVIKVSQIERNC